MAGQRCNSFDSAAVGGPEPRAHPLQPSGSGEAIQNQLPKKGGKPMRTIRLFTATVAIASTLGSIEAQAIACYGIDQTRSVPFTMSSTSLAKYPMEFSGDTVLLDAQSSNPSRLYFNKQDRQWCIKAMYVNKGAETCYVSIGENLLLQTKPGPLKASPPLTLQQGSRTIGRIELHGETARIIPAEGRGYIELSRDTDASAEFQMLQARAIMPGGSPNPTSYRFQHNPYLRSADREPMTKQIVTTPTKTFLDFSADGGPNGGSWVGGCFGVRQEVPKRPSIQPRTDQRSESEGQQEL